MKRTLVYLLVLVSIGVNSFLTEEQKRRCEQYTNVFESDSIQLDYSYVENLNNGRGLTAGRARFTTWSGDAYEVVRRYSIKRPANPLRKFESELKRLGERSSSDVSALNGYIIAWRRSSRDPLFRQIQDQVSDSLYYRPAMRYAENLHIESALGKCCLYDAIVQHGNGDDPDSFGAIIRKTESAEGGPVLLKANEQIWIQSFLRIRRSVIEFPENKQLRLYWRETVGRVDAFVDLIKKNNWQLRGPISIDTPNYSALII